MGVASDLDGLPRLDVGQLLGFLVAGQQGVQGVGRQGCLGKHTGQSITAADGDQALARRLGGGGWLVGASARLRALICGGGDQRCRQNVIVFVD
ncbi:hypothetical protein D9M71_315660 [compost metagenome]